VTESPWANPPSRSTLQSIRPTNWGFYLLVNIGLSIAAGIVVAGLAAAAHINLPGAGVNIAVLFLSIMIAGSRWLKAGGLRWTRSDRKRLALAYSAVNVGLSLLALVATFGLMQAGMGGDLGIPQEAMSLGAGPLAAIVAAAMLIAVGFGYVLTRVVLGVVVNSQAQATDENGNLL